MLNTILLQAAAQGGADFSGIIMIVALIAIFYFLMIRPQNKRQKKLREERAAMKKDDKVVTAGGIYGKIREVRDTTFVIEVAPNVKITVAKESVYLDTNAAEAQQDMQQAK